MKPRTRPSVPGLVLLAGASAIACGGMGCATRAPGPGYADVMSRAGPVLPDQARLVFFRANGHGWDQYSGYAVPVGVNGRRAGTLAHAGFFYVDVPAGPAELEAPHGSWAYPACRVRVSVDPGAAVYIEIAPRSRFLVAGIAGSVAGITLAGSLSQAALAGAAGDVAASAAESWGQACGGPFRFQPVEEATARVRLEDAEWSR